MKNLLVKSGDYMKKSKDAAINQLSDAEILDLVTRSKDLGLTHGSISIPMDRNSDFIANGNTPTPRTTEAHAAKWASTIHGAGLGVYWRGTFCGAELDDSGISGLFNFPLNNYNAFNDPGHVHHSFAANPIPQGTALSAATDGWNTWLGRIYYYITHNPSMFQSGDIWSPMPEQDNFLFNGGGGTPSTIFNANIQTNAQQFYTDVKTVSDAAFVAIGVTGVTTSYFSWNYHNYISGWLGSSFAQSFGETTVDYYGGENGSYTPDSYTADMNTLYTTENQPIFWGEWGYLKPRFPYTVDEFYYMKNWLQNITVLVNAGKIKQFNYWGVWDEPNLSNPLDSSVLYKDTNGKYQLNGLGKQLAAAFRGAVNPRVPVTDANGNF